MNTYMHHLPGRLRIRLAGVKASPRAAAAVEQYLQSLPGVRSSEANPLTGSVLVHYDPSLLDAGRLVGGLGSYSRAASLPCVKSASSHAPTRRRAALSHVFTKAVIGYLVEAAVERTALALLAAVL